MRRMWPDEFNHLLDGAEETTLDLSSGNRQDGSQGEAVSRRALKVRLSQADYERIWPLAESRYRLDGKYAGKAITLITNNPHYHSWHPVDGGTESSTSGSGQTYTTSYIVVHFLLDDVRETAAA